MNKMSNFAEKALDLNASSSMPDLAHHNKINLPTPLPLSFRMPLFVSQTTRLQAAPMNLSWDGLLEGPIERGPAVASEVSAPYLGTSASQTTTGSVCTHKKVTRTPIFAKQSSPVLLSRRGVDYQRAKFARGRNSRSPPLPETPSCASIMNQLPFVLRLGANHH